MTTPLHDAVRTRLPADVRYTRARQLLIDALAGAGRPVTAEEVCAGRTDLPLSSVYRNLVVFEESGVVRRLTGGEHARYELAEVLTGHHHHLTCPTCRSMKDIELPPALEAELDRESERIARDQGYQLLSHHLDLVGECPDCAARRGSA